jgi:PilZ domain
MLIAEMTSGHQFDLRNALRFPLHLQVTLKAAGKQYCAATTDISAGGLLFHIETAIDVGMQVQFTIEMPGEALGSDRPVLVDCQGRIVRCSEEGTGWSVAVVIDDYQFERR